MAVFRVEKNSGYTVMSNHHLRNRALSLKAKGLLSQMLSLPEDWDYTLQGLARINRESIDAIRQAIRELEQAGYIQRSRERDEKGRLRGADYILNLIFPNFEWENVTHIIKQSLPAILTALIGVVVTCGTAYLLLRFFPSSLFIGSWIACAIILLLFLAMVTWVDKKGQYLYYKV